MDTDRIRIVPGVLAEPDHEPPTEQELELDVRGGRFARLLDSFVVVLFGVLALGSGLLLALAALV